MGNHGVNEKDWKLFRSKMPGWQEAYMDRLNHEYMELLSGDGAPSDKFWALEERIRKDKKDTGVIASMKRSNMGLLLRNLLLENAITLDDLDGFSDELRAELTAYMELVKKWEESPHEKR